MGSRIVTLPLYKVSAIAFGQIKTRTNPRSAIIGVKVLRLALKVQIHGPYFEGQPAGRKSRSLLLFLASS